MGSRITAMSVPGSSIVLPDASLLKDGIVQHFFYNMVDPAQIHLYGRPANARNDSLWEKAVRENPDPKW